MLGLIQHEQQRYELAKPHFARSIELDPTYPAVYHFQGYCLSNLGELEAARSSFEKHLEFAPDEADTHFGIGLIDLEEDRVEDAERRFRRAIDLNEQARQRDPANRGAVRDLAKSRARLADVHLRRAELLQAKHELTLAVSLWPDHYEAWHKLHDVLVRLNEPQAAEDALRMHDLVKQRLRPTPVVPQAPEPG
jgi:tetratricopeptide (TPR) repeat protein